MNPCFLAHSGGHHGRIDCVTNHLQKVAERAAAYAKAFGASEEARLAGLLHDLGKYGSLFQERIKNPKVVHGIDHWSAGAWQALMEYKEKGVALGLAIQGHHVGLQKALELNSLNPANWDPTQHDGRRLSEDNPELLIKRMRDDGLNLATIASSIYDPKTHLKEEKEQASGMLDVRMLFSALVDADFIETEAHFNAVDDRNKGYRTEGPLLKPDEALNVLISHIESLAKKNKSTSSEDVSNLREDLLKACREAGSWKQGLFTLTAPTGAGKTLSMLAFALEHAKKHDLRRIVFVIPYLSIIEQTVKVYREVFPEKKFGIEYVLEHHSLTGTRGKDDTEDYYESRQKLLSENWDAPIIVTTSVQFLESLFANRSSACRKLHRLANSVILFDEVQTLPVALAVPTLAALSRLTERYNATVVFSTATQPAFTHLNEAVKKYCACGWKPKEIVPDNLKLFERARRTKVLWPDLDQRTSWDELAGTLKTHKQALCIVNLKRHALLLFQKLTELDCKEDELFHLSTNMCPEHRKDVLKEVHERLKQEKPCRLISTQCVEAGVDVDFPVVFRAWGPLDSIAQAAGRCNREGKADFGTVHVFLPDEEDYPDGSYRQAARITRMLKAQGQIDIHDPQLFLKYYRELYDLVRPDRRKENLIIAIKRQDFMETAKLYRVIEKDAVNVLVPYDKVAFNRLEKEVNNKGITKQWITKARPYTIGLYNPKHGDRIRDWLVQVKANNQPSEDWFIYLNKEHYNPKTGLVPPASTECIIS